MVIGTDLVSLEIRISLMINIASCCFILRYIYELLPFIEKSHESFIGIITEIMIIFDKIGTPCSR
jgi:hypothetical protein